MFLTEGQLEFNGLEYDPCQQNIMHMDSGAVVRAEVVLRWDDAQFDHWLAACRKLGKRVRGEDDPRLVTARLAFLAKAARRYACD